MPGPIVAEGFGFAAAIGYGTHEALDVVGQVEMLAIGIGQGDELVRPVVAGGDGVAVGVLDVIESAVGVELGDVAAGIDKLVAPPLIVSVVPWSLSSSL